MAGTKIDSLCMSVSSFYLHNIINVYLAVLVFIQCICDAEQLLLRNALDLPHYTNELFDADQVLPTGWEHTAYRKRLLANTENEMMEEEHLG